MPLRVKETGSSDCSLIRDRVFIEFQIRNAWNGVYLMILRVEWKDMNMTNIRADEWKKERWIDNNIPNFQAKLPQE